MPRRAGEEIVHEKDGGDGPDPSPEPAPDGGPDPQPGPEDNDDGNGGGQSGAGGDSGGNEDKGSFHPVFTISCCARTAK